MKELLLPLKVKWYRMIESGEKKEEYRQITPYWCVRLLGGKNNLRFWRQQWLTHVVMAQSGTEAYIHNLINEYGVIDYRNVHFTLGYPRKDDTSRHMVKRIKDITIGTGRPEWGAEPGKKYFVIKFED